MPRQRIEAFRLVTAARLATLADEVQQAVRAEEELIVRAFGVECEVALGLRAPAAAAELVPTAQPPR
jgi:hypothetical protein